MILQSQMAQECHCEAVSPAERGIAMTVPVGGGDPAVLVGTGVPSGARQTGTEKLSQNYLSAKIVARCRRRGRACPAQKGRSKRRPYSGCLLPSGIVGTISRS